MIEGKRKALQQVVYTFGNIVGLGLAVYKCQVMGLLPTHPSDWLAFVEPQKVIVFVYINVQLVSCYRLTGTEFCKAIN